MDTSAYVIFLNGTYGVGKSSTLDHVGDLLAEHGKAFAVMDVDWFHRSWPPTGKDPDNVITEAANMAAVWENYSRDGPRQLVVSGVIASERDQLRYEAALSLPIRAVRLVADTSVIEARLRVRYGEHRASTLAWHLQRHRTLARRLAQNNMDELVVDAGRLSPRSVASEVIHHFDVLTTAHDGEHRRR